MLTRFKRLIDLNKTLRHVSYGEMKRSYERQQHQTVRLFRFLVISALITIAVVSLWQLFQ